MDSQGVFPSVAAPAIPFDQLDPVNDVAYWGEAIRAVLNILGRLRGAPVLLARPLLFAEEDGDLEHFEQELAPLSFFLSQRHPDVVLGEEAFRTISQHVQAELRAIRALEILHSAAVRRQRELLGEMSVAELITIQRGARGVGEFLELLRDRIAETTHMLPAANLTPTEARDALIASETPVGVAHYLAEIQARVVALIETAITVRRDQASLHG